MLREVAWREGRILLHHRDRLPAPQLFQHHQRRAMLHVPARPGVAQIVPVEVDHSGRPARTREVPLVDLPNQLGWPVSARVLPREYEVSSGSPALLQRANHVLSERYSSSPLRLRFSVCDPARIRRLSYRERADSVYGRRRKGRRAPRADYF